jgi:uncharacterized protein (TIGR02217 family)
MTTPPFFPSLPGQAWPVVKKPKWSTRIASHSSGREVRVRLWANPMYEFEVSYDALSSSDNRQGIAAHSMQMMMDFYSTAQGQGGTFLYVDPTDCLATGQIIGVGDSATLSFSMVRSLLSFTEKVGWVTSISAVYIDGISQTLFWDLAAPSTLVFTSPVPVGSIVTADFSWAFVCRFSEDTMEASQFMEDLWEMKSLKFQSVRS